MHDLDFSPRFYSMLHIYRPIIVHLWDTNVPPKIIYMEEFLHEIKKVKVEDTQVKITLRWGSSFLSILWAYRLREHINI